ncbi:hypothetical protein HPB47_003868 [Ixodes persulcatus]|uniref:Uncharacterized protein n=1 Tax=Ixodes persulcatus TaxID=34615 RepID=A0AC60PHA2_IXOPE|nr:hypothetical protein HPB47_003868 [Ixodes persulcatus]
MNTIREIAEEMRISQAQRLSRTPHGQIILASIGRSDLIHGPLMPTPTPPWDAEAVTPIKPLPSHQGPNHPGRRATQGVIHRAEVGKLAVHVDVFYTDAARDNNGRTAIAWHSPTRKETNHKLTECTRSSCMAELLAVLFAAETATTCHEQKLQKLEYTPTPKRRCVLYSSRAHATLQLRASANWFVKPGLDKQSPSRGFRATQAFQGTSGRTGPRAHCYRQILSPHMARSPRPFNGTFHLTRALI